MGVYGFLINSHGFLWISIFLWWPMAFHGFLWISMDFYRFLWMSLDFFWVSVDFYGFLKMSIDFYDVYDFHGCLWISMGFSGFLWFLWVPMDSLGFLWSSIDFYGCLWIFMNFYWVLWLFSSCPGLSMVLVMVLYGSIDFYGCLWMSMDVYGVLWLSMDFHDFHEFPWICMDFFFAVVNTAIWLWPHPADGVVVSHMHCKPLKWRSNLGAGHIVPLLSPAPSPPLHSPRQILGNQ